MTDKNEPSAPGRDVERTAPPEGTGSSFLGGLYDSLASVTLAIYLLIFLALTSVIGTVVLQKGRPEQYLMEYGPGVYRFLQFLALDDMYRSWWFLTLLILLLVNITLCSVKRFPRAWRLMTQSPRVLDDALFKRMKHRGSVRRGIAPQDAVGEAERILASRFGKVRRERDGGSETLYVDRGWYGRLGAYVVHLSILILAVGALIGGLRGFKGFVAIVEGQAVDRVPLRGKNTAVKLDFIVRCDDFKVEYYPGTQQPKDYYSDLTVIRGGQEVQRKRIEVNHPLIVDGIYFYQSSYGVDQNSTVTFQVLDPSGTVAGPDVTVRAGQSFNVMGDSSTYVIQQIFPDYMGGSPAVQMSQFLGSGRRDFLVSQAAPDRDRLRGGPVYLSIKNTAIREYTGLQVAWDPGVPVVWLACAIMIIGLYIAFFVPHRRVWIRVDLDADETAVLMAGTTNRNPATFERDFEEALSELKGALKGRKG
ncbi:MAG: cytochrome c biogenesis protein ResB [bacterium]|nr:MAG: cytochrome c biogenesis protein ResB [bacterium]